MTLKACAIPHTVKSNHDHLDSLIKAVLYFKKPFLKYVSYNRVGFVRVFKKNETSPLLSNQKNYLLIHFKKKKFKTY